MKQTRTIIILAASFVLIIAIVFYAHIKHAGPARLGEAEFQEYVASLQLPHRSPAYKNVAKLGCRQDHTQKDSSDDDCTYSSMYAYVFDSSYREIGQEMFSYLKTKGFDFKPGDKYKKEVNDKLHNTALNANLSNSEPIIVDLYNDAKGVRVRVYLGDKGRTMPRINGQGFRNITNQQLVGGLEFFEP